MDEKNPKWLQDDYVKFIRFSQWRIDRTGEGIVALITNHGYLDNPTFRGMRQQLVQAFSAIYIYDLHGNTKKKERAPDGGQDENVFDIMQGVAIMFCIKQSGHSGPGACIVVICGARARRSTNALRKQTLAARNGSRSSPSRRIIFLPPAIPGLPASIVTAIQ